MDADVDKAQREASAAFAVRNQRERKLRSKEDTRVGKWEAMMVPDRDSRPLARYKVSQSVSPQKLRRRIYKGVPDRWRPAVWDALLEMRSKKSIDRNGELAETFSASLSVASPHDVQIDLDVPRTISGHIMFHTRYGLGQRNLFHVLHAFSLRCDDCAYCQGMGPIAATLLCYLIPERAYAGMVTLHDSYDLHKIFSPGFPGLVELFYVQNELMKLFMPNLLKRLEEHMITTSSYATKWYITLFNGIVPFETQLRIWDAFLLEGPNVLNITTLAILWNLAPQLLDPAATFEYTLGSLSSFLIPENDDAFLLWTSQALARRSVKDAIRTARARWQEMEASGETRDIAL